MIVIDPHQMTALATTLLTTQTTVDAHTQDPSRLHKLCIVLPTHLDRLIVHNRKDLVLPLPLRIGHLIVPLPVESREKGLGAIGRTIMIDENRWTLTLHLHLLGIIPKETIETFRRLQQPTLLETDRGNCSLSLLLLLLGPGSLMIHLGGTLLAHHHLLETGTPLRLLLTQGGGGLLRRKMRIGRLGLLRLVGKISRLLWIGRGRGQVKGLIVMHHYHLPEARIGIGIFLEVPLQQTTATPLLLLLEI